MPQLESPPGLWEDSPGSTMRSACPVSDQRLYLAKGLQISPGGWGMGLRHGLQVSLPLNLQLGRTGREPGE